MNGERGYFGIGIIHGKTTANLGTLWRSAYNMGADFVFTVGNRYTRQSSDTLATPRHVPLFHFEDVDDLVAHLPHGCPLIGVELDPRSVPLHTFKHPERACYLLGAEDNGIDERTLAKCHRIVEIEGPSRCLNVAVSGSIVMYDRMQQIAHGVTAGRSW